VNRVAEKEEHQRWAPKQRDLPSRFRLLEALSVPPWPLLLPGGMEQAISCYPMEQEPLNLLY